MNNTEIKPTLSGKERRSLIRRRLWNGPEYDFMPHNGRCGNCGTDLVKHYHEDYPTVYVSGCPKCNRTWCD